MGQLYDLCSRVTTYLESKHADDPLALIRAKGEIATRTGFLVSMVSPNEFDDPNKIARLREAVSRLGIPA